MPPALTSAHADFAAASRSTLEDLSPGGRFDLFLVARATDRWWTPLTAVRTTDALPAHLRTHFPLEATACHRLLVDRRPVVTRDLRRHGDAQVRENSRTHHVAGYAGAAIRRPDGRLLGSLCAFSASRFTGDVDPLVAQLHEGADRLGHELGRALDVLADERRGSYDRALRSADDATRLPDRRGWGLMLRDEEERSRDLAEDAAVVLVDTGLVRTTRGVRRAAGRPRQRAPVRPAARRGPGAGPRHDRRGRPGRPPDRRLPRHQRVGGPGGDQHPGGDLVALGGRPAGRPDGCGPMRA